MISDSLVLLAGDPPEKVHLNVFSLELPNNSYFIFGKCRQLMGEELSGLDINQLKHLENHLQIGLNNVQRKKVSWFKAPT